MSELKQVLEIALALPEAERAFLVEKLVSSLDCPNPEIDRLWAVEAEERLAAYRAGMMAAIPAEDVFAELSGQ